MKQLSEIITCFNSDDKREFLAFVKRQKKKSNRKDIELFNLILDKPHAKPKDLILALYGTENRPAFYRLCSRLQSSLEQFILLRSSNGTFQVDSEVNALVATADYLYINGQSELSGTYYEKAQSHAEANAHYAILDMIYRKRIQHLASHGGENAIELYDKYLQNKSMADNETKLEAAYAILREELKNRRKGRHEINFSELVTHAFEHVGLSEDYPVTPKTLHTLASIAREEMFSRKDFYSFEPYLLSSFNKLSEEHLNLPQHHYHHLSLLYMIAHIYYRNRKINDARNYLELLNASMSTYASSLKKSFTPRYLGLMAAIEVYSKNNARAIELISEGLNLKEVLSSDIYHYNFLLNKAVYFFNAADFKAANRTLIQFPHTDSFLEKKLGSEWVMKKRMVEIIVQYEIGNSEIALSRIKNMKRKYAEFFTHPLYARVQTFLKFIELVITKPELISSSEFIKQVEGQLTNVPNEREDTQAVAFYCWLKSKMYKTDYYKTLIETIKQH